MGGLMTPADKIAYRERQAKALELRKDGLTYQQIADALGYANRDSARKAVDAALRHERRERAR